MQSMPNITNKTFLQRLVHRISKSEIEIAAYVYFERCSKTFKDVVFFCTWILNFVKKVPTIITETEKV